MKLADFLRKIAEQGGIVDADFNAVLGASGLAEFEVKDEIMTKFNQTFLTRERAENDPDIIKKIKSASKSEVLDLVDSDLKNLMDVLPKERADEIAKNKNTFEKLAATAKAVKETLEAKSTKVDKDIQKVEQEWAEKLAAEKSQAAKQLKELEKRNRDNALTYVLKNKILSHDFADAFKPLKDNLAEVIINKVKTIQENGTPIILDLDEGGNVNVRHEIEGTLRDVYRDGNQKLTLDMLLTPQLEPYIKKSNAEPGEPKTNGKQKTPPVDPSKMTLAEQRALLADN